MRLLEYEWYVRGGPKIPYALHHLKERFITAPMFADYKSDLLEVLFNDGIQGTRKQNSHSASLYLLDP